MPAEEPNPEAETAIPNPHICNHGPFQSLEYMATCILRVTSGAAGQTSAPTHDPG